MSCPPKTLIRIFSLPLLLVHLEAKSETSLKTQSVQFSGIAYSSPRKSETLYRETHSYDYQNGRLRKSETRYELPDGQEIGSLRCVYLQEPYLPNFHFRDHRAHYEEKGELKGDSYSVWIREGSKETNYNVSLRSKMAISQGLNQLIVSQLRHIRTEKDVEVDFILPSRQLDIGMLISGEALDERRTKVSIQIRNFLIRLFAPTLQMTYDLSGRLLSYHGNSNLLSPEKKPQRVFIEYQHTAQDPIAQSEEPQRPEVTN